MSETTVGLTPDGSTGNGHDTTTTAAATTKQPKRGSVTSDPRLVACIRIDKMLGALSGEDRSFVLTFIRDKYDVEVDG